MNHCPEALWETLARADDTATFFQTPAWHKLAAAHFRAESRPLLFEFPDGPACLPLLRERRWGRWRWFSPFGTYTALVCPRTLNAAELATVAAALSKLNLHLVSSPFTRNAVQVGRPLVSRVQVIDLDAVDAANPMRDWEEGQRRRVRVAAKSGVRVRLAAADGPQADADWDRYHELYALSLQRWGHKATVAYPRALFESIRRELAGSPALKLWLAERDGITGAGYLTFYHNRHVVPWHGAADAEFFQWGSTQALFHEMVGEARREGYAWFDLTGSGGLSGVEAFKARFGTRTIGFESSLNRAGLAAAAGAAKDALLRIARGRG